MIPAPQKGAVLGVVGADHLDRRYGKAFVAREADRPGVGRLVRTNTDQGIIVILDNRVLTKRYGRAFLDALPKCPVETV